MADIESQKDNQSSNKNEKANLAKVKREVTLKILIKAKEILHPERDEPLTDIKDHQIDSLFCKMSQEAEDKFLELRVNKTFTRGSSLRKQPAKWFIEVAKIFADVKLDEEFYGKSHQIADSFSSWYKVMYPKANTKEFTPKNLTVANIVDYCFKKEGLSSIPSFNGVVSLKSKIINLNENAIDEMYSIIVAAS